MTTKRLIERWLPIAEIGIESVRERTPMTPFPAPNRLHVWWARRPLVASRAAVLASILPENADRDEYKHALGIHGDPVRGVTLIERAKRTGVRVADPYGYDRAFNYAPSETEMERLAGPNRSEITVLDATAGGGAIPLEAIRLGFSALGNDLNPVAALLQKATIEFPQKHGDKLIDEFRELSTEFRRRIGETLEDYIPQPNAPDEVATAFLWARTIVCPYCAGSVPLSPSWRLGPDGTGIKVKPHEGVGPGDEHRHCSFEIVTRAEDQSNGTIAGGDAACPYPDCGRTIGGDEVKRQAQSGHMGDQLFAVVVKKRIIVQSNAGKDRVKWVRSYRAPQSADNNTDAIADLMEKKLPEWEALDILPYEKFPPVMTDNRFATYSEPYWRAMFSQRQLLFYGTAVQIFRDMFLKDEAEASLNPERRSAYVYLAIVIDRMLDYNSRMSAWHAGREVLEHTFRDHVFVMK